MAKLFEITDDIRQIAADGFDDLIDQLGKLCTLVYPAEPVTNPAVTGSLTGDMPPSRWVTGGAGSPEWGRDATGTVAVPPTEQIRLLINWTPRDSYDEVAGRRLAAPAGAIEVQGYQADLSKLMRADTILVPSAKQTAQRLAFRRAADPIDRANICPDRYFVGRRTRVE